MSTKYSLRIWVFTATVFAWMTVTSFTSAAVGQDFPGGDLFGEESVSAETDEPDIDLASASSASDALALFERLPSRLSANQLAALRQWDRRWSIISDADAKQLIEDVTHRLARSGEPRSLSYLHQVYETVPARRQTIAMALAEYAELARRRPEDWRLLVRSLPILEGDAIVPVLAALKQFPQRGTKPEWQRQVVLAGLRSGGDADTGAAALLGHWTGQSLASLTEWQDWFHQTHPQLPRAELPVDSTDSRYKYTDLLDFLRSQQGDPRAGAEVYEKAQCIRCHRIGDRGEAMGGDLTSARRKFQDKELLQSLLYPSYVIPEEYTAKMILDEKNRRYTGVTTNSGSKIVILTTGGQKIEIPRDQIQEIRPSTQSAMPSGLLDSLSRKEIADLFAYLLGPTADQAGY